MLCETKNPKRLFIKYNWSRLMRRVREETPAGRCFKEVCVAARTYTKDEWGVHVCKLQNFHTTKILLTRRVFVSTCAFCTAIVSSYNLGFNTLSNRLRFIINQIRSDNLYISFYTTRTITYIHTYIYCMLMQAWK